MASSLPVHSITFKCDGVVAKGHAVKKGTDDNHVAECTAASDKSIGVAQETTTAAEQFVTVAMAGGGGKGVCQTTVGTGDLLCSHTDGTLKPSTTTGERIVAMAVEAGVAADVIGIQIVNSLHY